MIAARTLATPDDRGWLIRTVAVALLLTAVASPGVAQAQTDVESRVQTLLEDAYADYDVLQLQAAQSKLQQATELVSQFGIQGENAASAFMMLGVVRFALTGDDNAPVEPFVQALLIDPDAELPAYYATPTLQEILDRARGLLPDEAVAEPEPPASPSPPTTAAPTPPPQPTARPQALQHVPVRQATAGQPLNITAVVPVDVPAHRVMVHYRPYGAAQFTDLAMEPQSDGATFVGRLPPQATARGVTMEYFITVTNRAGTVIGAAGSATTPITVALMGGSDPIPDESRGRRSAERDPADRDRERREIGHVSFGPGTGMGVATGEPNVFADDVNLNPGIALTPLHLLVELGFAATPSFHIVPFARLQLVFLETGVELEPIAGLKLRWVFLDRERLRLFTELGGGYGDISHFVYLEPLDQYDTTNEGPFHVGPGLGLIFMFNPVVGLQAEAYSLITFDQIAANLDLNVALRLAF